MVHFAARSVRTAAATAALCLLAAGCGTAGATGGTGETGETGGSGGTVRTPKALPQAPRKPGPGGTCPTIEIGGPAPTTIDGTPANIEEAMTTSEALARIVEAPDSRFADTYGEMINDHPAGRVAVCVTDLTRGRELLAAAQQASPKADLTRADLYTCPFPRRTLEAARDRVSMETGAYSFPVIMVGPGDACAGLNVGSTAAGAASEGFRAELSKVAGVPVKVEHRDMPSLLG
ncbi:hypothetical protein LG634_11475 [Streptomyces bambusae]|uniref:hypothetical protein n=1 Tax=Streptomyces bambusae TaxID=1550616 RepID=UPI001CFCBAA0|nr:hypothetical protein [Streptomyces bambusae]MCB5165449.1 hypothetical protein [Streptomyces bambusae]